MIKLDLLKIGKWGMAICGGLFVLGMIVIMFFIPKGETALYWFIYIGYPTALAKTGFIISLVIWVIGLVLNQKEPEDKGS